MRLVTMTASGKDFLVSGDRHDFDHVIDSFFESHRFEGAPSQNPIDGQWYQEVVKVDHEDQMYAPL